ncbi:MAG: HD-GYP domain-containing protein [Alphaproteobacteria bacterium]|nr:HD-GYP domain-containing protein [Alphaproteobacteria bacterium]MDE2336616.1 HD-GYP domain-containing protein [Alphaproteobacteria bacterium]
MSVTKEQVILSLYQTVRTLSDTIGLKEVYTPGHQHNVAQLARTIGQVMGLDNDAVDGLRIGAMLHDFGIIRIPAEILNKPGKLTQQEYETMKQHPVHGYQILKSIEFPWPVARMILQHHERLDGSGYPGGISGDDIIPEARIIAVADVMDSMISDRPWRRALPLEKAMDELKSGSGTKYDPAAVTACIEIYMNRRELLDPKFYNRNAG